MQWIRNRISNIGTIGSKIGWTGSAEYAGLEPEKGVSFARGVNKTEVERYNKGIPASNYSGFKQRYAIREKYKTIFDPYKYTNSGIQFIFRIVKQQKEKEPSHSEIIDELIEEMKEKDSHFAAEYERHSSYSGGSKGRRMTMRKRNRKSRKTRSRR